MFLSSPVSELKRRVIINIFLCFGQCSQNETSNPMCYYSSPQESVVSHAVRVVSTWSKICVITSKGYLYVGGLKHKDDNMLYKYSDQMFSDIAAKSDNFTIFKRTIKKWCVIAEGEITVKDLDIKEEVQLKEVAGCDKELAVVSEDQHVYSASLHQSLEGPVNMTLTLICGSLKIQSVSCGKEHVLLMSFTGEVYSYGMGSRGQLGHGDLHVDWQTAPHPVETLSGLAVTGIAAGGWHSAAVTAEGDLYVWGWNESGQLGLSNRKEKVKEFNTSQEQSNTKVTSAHERTFSLDDLQPENLRRNSGVSFLNEWDVRQSGQLLKPNSVKCDRFSNAITRNSRHSCNESEFVSGQLINDEQMFIKICDAWQSNNKEKSQSEVNSVLKAQNSFVDIDQHCSDFSDKTDFVIALTNGNIEKPANKLIISKACNSKCSEDSRNFPDIRKESSGDNEKLYQNSRSFKEAWHNQSMNTALKYSEAKRRKFSDSWNSGNSFDAGDTDLDINERQSFNRNIQGHVSTKCSEQRSSIKLHQQRTHLVYHQDTEPIQIQSIPQVLALPEAVKVRKVSCGSRHTAVLLGIYQIAVLLDNGCLMTTGWNGYGQLCHGDLVSRDFLQTVSFFTDQQLVVTNVFCDVWTTAIITQ